MKKIIAATLVMCLLFAIIASGNQLNLSLENKSMISSEDGRIIMIVIGVVATLIGAYTAATNADNPTSVAFGSAVGAIGLGVSFYNWSKLVQEKRAERIVFWSNKAQEVMESWVGQHESDLIASWGPPNKIMPDGKGGTVLDYSHYRDFGYRGYIDRFGNLYGYPLGYTADRYFYVDSNGIIYNFKWKGL